MNHSDYIKHRDEIIEGIATDNSTITTADGRKFHSHLAWAQHAIDQLALDVIGEDSGAREGPDRWKDFTRQAQRQIVRGEDGIL